MAIPSRINNLKHIADDVIRKSVSLRCQSPPRLSQVIGFISVFHYPCFFLLVDHHNVLEILIVEYLYQYKMRIHRIIYTASKSNNLTNEITFTSTFIISPHVIFSSNTYRTKWKYLALLYETSDIYLQKWLTHWNVTNGLVLFYIKIYWLFLHSLTSPLSSHCPILICICQKILYWFFQYSFQLYLHYKQFLYKFH